MYAFQLYKHRRKFRYFSDCVADSYMSNILKYTVEEYRDCSLEEIMNCIEGDTIQTGTALVEEDMAKTIRGEDTEFHTTDEAPAAFDILFRSLNPKAEGKLLVNLHIDF